MITIKNLKKSYGKNEVLKGINLTINEGDIYAFVGSNGAGKTTTIKSMLGILPFDSGDVLYDDLSIKTDGLKIKEELAYIPDNPDIYEHLTGLEYLNFIADMYETSEEYRNKKIKEYAKELEIDTKLNDKIGSYSHGMKQKIVIISALIHDPKVIIMDEPFVGLDPISTHTLKEIMKKLTKEGKIIFFSTHVLDVAEKLCNKIAIIKNGKIIAEGSMKELTKNSSLEDIFLELVSNE
ncbi:MAG: ABC transporter ATP-binding protein [Bacilli bacterium]|nr:ABC transporter ATP-binding protein [Bacilli bacterium]